MKAAPHLKRIQDHVRAIDRAGDTLAASTKVKGEIEAALTKLRLELSSMIRQPGEQLEIQNLVDQDTGTVVDPKGYLDRLGAKDAQIQTQESSLDVAKGAVSKDRKTLTRLKGELHELITDPDSVPELPFEGDGEPDAAGEPSAA